MSLKHTPGPWTVTNGGLAVQAGDRRIALLAVTGSQTAEDYEMAKTDARLIAAAPLLAEIAVEYYEHLIFSHEAQKEPTDRIGQLLSWIDGEVKL